jgi:hypothetical protein
MKIPNDGGSVFPTISGKYHIDEGAFDARKTQSGEFTAQGGMTLRDYFAARAMPLAQEDGGHGTAAEAEKEFGMKPGTYSARIHRPLLMAKAAYQYADAMIAERKPARPKPARL